MSGSDPIKPDLNEGEGPPERIAPQVRPGGEPFGLDQEPDPSSNPKKKERHTNRPHPESLPEGRRGVGTRCRTEVQHRAKTAVAG